MYTGYFIKYNKLTKSNETCILLLSGMAFQLQLTFVSLKKNTGINEIFVQFNATTY